MLETKMVLGLKGRKMDAYYGALAIKAKSHASIFSLGSSVRIGFSMFSGWIYPMLVFSIASIVCFAFTKQTSLAQEPIVRTDRHDTTLNDWRKRVVQLEVRPLDSADGNQVVVGTGVILNANGLVVSCDHVISSEGSIDAVLEDGSRLAYLAIARCPQADLVFLKPIVDQRFETKELACELHPSVGEDIATIFNYANTGVTITKGAVSALDRRTFTESLVLEDVLMANITVGPGGSGAPVFLTDGKWIGIVASMEQDRAFVYVIPVERIAKEFIRVFSSQVWSGKEYSFFWSTTRELRPAINPKENGGLTQVTAVQERKVTSIFDVLPLLANEISADRLTLTIERDGKSSKSEFLPTDVKLKSISPSRELKPGLRVIAAPKGKLDEPTEHLIDGFVPDLDGIYLRQPDEAIDLRYEGYFFAKTTGRYEFIIESVPEVTILLDNQARIDKPPAKISRGFADAYYLEEGHHPLSVEIRGVNDIDNFGILVVEPTGIRDVIGHENLFREK